jgi:hypothetical protein
MYLAEITTEMIKIQMSHVAHSILSSFLVRLWVLHFLLGTRLLVLQLWLLLLRLLLYPAGSSRLAASNMLPFETTAPARAGWPGDSRRVPCRLHF